MRVAETRFCEVCGGEIPYRPTDGYKKYLRRRFCSRRCADDAKSTREKEPTGPTCHWCGKAMRKQTPDGYCSTKCRGKGERLRVAMNRLLETFTGGDYERPTMFRYRGVRR